MMAVVATASSPLADAVMSSTPAAISSSSTAGYITWDSISQLLSSQRPVLSSLASFPGSGVIWRYIKSSHQNDPARTFLELLLFLFVVYTWLKGRTRSDKTKNYVQLSKKEIDELVAEWQPEPLLIDDAELMELPQPPVIMGPPGLHAKVITDSGDQPAILLNSAEAKAHEKSVINLASHNYSGLALNEVVKEKAIECLRGYGVGSCGPAGFYGFFDVHIELENALANFLGTEASIIYPQGFTTVCSVIPTFAKRGDIIVADKGVNFAIQKGIQISRTHIRWFEHNNMDHLEEVLETLAKEQRRSKAPLTRRFIVTEGLFESDGQICNLPRLLELKRKYKYRLMLDETMSIGVLGKTGRGVSELYNVPASETDILMGSMAVGLCSGGGFCAGSSPAIGHQRINSAAYVFSASLPPLLAVAANEGLRFLQGGMSPNGQLPLTNLQTNIKALRSVLDRLEGVIYIPSSPLSPLIHIHIHPQRARELDFYEQERVLQEISDDCVANGVLIVRTKKVWKQESVPGNPSLRISVSAGHSKKDMEKAASVIRTSILAKLGKKR